MSTRDDRGREASDPDLADGSAVTDPSATGSAAPESSAGVPWRSPTVQVVLASTLLAPLGVPLVSPALPVVRDAFALADAEASLLVSAYFAVGIVLSPFIGVVVDRVGRRRVLVPSLVVFSVAGGAIAVAPDFATVLLIRLVQGVASAGIFITTVTIIADAFDGVGRNAVFGANNAALAAGAAVFPIVGGVLAAISWNAPFLAYLVGLPVAVAAYVLLDEPESERETRSLAYLRGAARALAGRDALTYYGAAFVTEALALGAIITALPFLLSAEFALSPLLIGLTLTASEIAAIVVSMGNGRLARRFTNQQLVAAGYACYGVGLAGAWIAPSPAVVAAAVFVFGAGLGLSVPAVDAAVSHLVPGRFRAGALSIRNSTTFLGRATGPVFFAGVAAATGYRPLLGVAAVAALALAVVTLAAVRPLSEDAPVPDAGGG
ncbi:MFS transporter [Halomarina pelagica]|uniref:MFS transporter n=1 Tax=Halomarina pelagica TaxID=2961599 RepID=UPI0020C51B3D|nr:MFS transporter [Halomarina sp. BND7]